MKKGQKVIIRDGSYMTTIINGKIAHSGIYPSTKTIGWCKDVFTIVALGGKYPTDNSCVERNKLNDCIIQNDINGEIWFCDTHVNIRPVVNEVPEYTMEQLTKRIGHEFKIKK